MKIGTEVEEEGVFEILNSEKDAWRIVRDTDASGKGMLRCVRVYVRMVCRPICSTARLLVLQQWYENRQNSLSIVCHQRPLGDKFLKWFLWKEYRRCWLLVFELL